MFTTQRADVNLVHSSITQWLYNPAVLRYITRISSIKSVSFASAESLNLPPPVPPGPRPGVSYTDI